jgi:hypothetical protein
VPERIEADAAKLPGGIVAEMVRDEAVRRLVKGDCDDEWQNPDGNVVEGDVHGCPEALNRP